MKLLQEFNFILEQVQKAKKYITIIRKFSSFWFCFFLFLLLLFFRRNEKQAQKQTVKEAFKPNQIALLKKPVSQVQVIGIHIGAAELSSTSDVVQECSLGKLKSLNDLKIY